MQAGGGGDAGDTRGRHRIQAELKKLEQEARFLEEELEELDKTDKAYGNSGEQSGSSTSRLLGLLASLGTDGLKVRKICADANAVTMLNLVNTISEE
uniref:Uncharacterized protein n=2 Tax=Oryza TaxID=4527 RepID=A0A0E0GQU9_ORYNI